MVSFLLVVGIFLLAATVSAAPIGTISDVEVDGINVNDNPAIVTGENVNVRVEFNSDVNASDVTVEVEIEGDKKDVEAQSRYFDVEQGFEYKRTLSLEVPFDLNDELSNFVTLNVEISGDGYKTEDSYTLRVQRTSYNADIKSISVPQTITAGDIVPVDIVFKNLGYNDLEDVYVTASIPALGIERTDFFGDIVALECDDSNSALDNYGVDIDRKCNENDEDTLSGRLFLEVPYSVESGIYTLEIEVENDDTTSSEAVQVVIENAFSSGNFIVSGNELLVVNPTNEVVAYRIVPESTSTVSVRASDSIIAVPSGASKTVMFDAVAQTSGTQTYTVNIFSVDGKLVDSVEFVVSGEGNSTNPIVVLTVILAIIFVVLLIVLIVLIGKKPERTEEFGESYY